jgi:hypothetical protein
METLHEAPHVVWMVHHSKLLRDHPGDARTRPEFTGEAKRGRTTVEEFG